MELKTSKIVGAANQTTWSQVHVFPPQPEAGQPLAEEKLQSHGQLLAALSFKAKHEGIEVSSFGTEIIKRLQEMYYSNESEKVIKKVAQTMESLAAEFLSEVELNLVLAVVWQDFLYCGKAGGGQVYLKRGEALVKLLSEAEETTVVSGSLKDQDKLLIGTGQFFRIVPEETLKPIMEQTDDQQAEEALAGIVHGHETNSQTAAVLVRAGKQLEVKAEAEPATEEVIGVKEENKWRVKWQTLAEKGWLWLRRFKVRGGGLNLRKQQKSAATVALVLVLVFGVSLVLAGRKRQKTKAETRYQAVVEEVRYKYDEAKGLLSLNPLRAKSLLKDSQALMTQYETESGKELSGELKDYQLKIEETLGSVQREYQLESAQEWYDFGLVKEGFKGSDWESEENEALVWDAVSRSLVSLNLETKAAKVVLGGDKLSGGELVGLAGERGLVVSKDRVTVVEVKEGKVVAEVGADGWGTIQDAVGFGGNLYLLDKTVKGQIWKYLGVEAGLSGKRSYLKGESYDLSEAVSMAIDGSVWVLFSDGTIAKYVQGVKDVFVVAGLDKAFDEPVKIFTSPETESVYILDRKNTRVVVIAKNGEYKAQYVWPGIAGVKDLIVNETQKKIFLLTGEKIFTVELK